ncbi:DNA-protecting protein DprA [bacterium]|jgi:DNA processing protein|nr:DNA-protecting protein DprA [bacterium]MBT6832355.1 DNA-protecting protein DprA [bacterium]MBT6995900.1 DNA-protecting protein DprA [bacterium]MBT7772761.1 DNA-protecting protein DprA [bacterium]
MNDEKFLVALHRGMNLTFARFGKLQKFFGGDWRATFDGKIKDFQAADLDPRGIEKFLSVREKLDPDWEIEQLEKCGARVLVFGRENFPQNLESIHNPPALLFCRGEFLDTDFPAIAVVGSRKLTSYGRRAGEKIVGEIAAAGITIVSGLAFGADTLAHQIAVKNGARTIAVLGNGIDTVYPQQNAKFAAEFLAKNCGAVLSEYLPGTEVRPENFPVRNRIVAGLAKAVIVLEAAEKSGSLITAELAVEMGRDIFAVPGEIFAENSAGTNALIFKSQAAPALSGEQILENLGLKNLAPKKAAQLAIPTTSTEAEILKLLESGEKVHLDDLVRNSPFPAPVTSSTISILEIKGLVRNLGQQIYVKNV